MFGKHPDVRKEKLSYLALKETKLSTISITSHGFIFLPKCYYLDMYQGCRGFQQSYQPTILMLCSSNQWNFSDTFELS